MVVEMRGSRRDNCWLNEQEILGRGRDKAGVGERGKGKVNMGE